MQIIFKSIWHINEFITGSATSEEVHHTPKISGPKVSQSEAV